MVGNYTISSLPVPIQDELSFGLTRLLPDQTATAGAALSWTATDSGKTIVFHLDPNLFWQDGTKFDTSQINYRLKGVNVKRLSLTDISFSFQKPFAPLPAIVSQPIFKNGLVGLGDYKLKSLKFNGKFLSELTLQNLKTGLEKTYKFYPSDKEAVTALKLGSVTSVQNIHSAYDLSTDPNYIVKSATDSGTVAALFINLTKKKLDQKAFRQALAYGLPDKFPEGELAYSLSRLESWVDSSEAKKYLQNTALSEEVFDKKASSSAKQPLFITTSMALRPVALRIASVWTGQGQPVKVETSEFIPSQFDIYLAYLTVPVDPDQYALWHSTQKGNISGYKSPKVDKLLEEGRNTMDPKERKKIYAEFQKALSEDLPAIFLFYPRVYTISRK